MRRFALLVILLALAGPAGAGTVPSPVADAVHGRVFGWAQSGSSWFAAYVESGGSGWCGLGGTSWRIGLVDSVAAPARVTDDRVLGKAMCGNDLAWVRAGRFSDGRHREVAFMLWTTPSICATTYVFRIDGGRLRPLASFRGDRVTLGRGTVTVGFENRGRSPSGELRQTWRFDGTRYRLVSRH